MKRHFLKGWLFVALLSFLATPMASFAREAVQQWDLINPEGVIKIEPMEVMAHPASLEGKTVMLRWNGKHNGDIFLSRIGELLAKEVKGVKILKSWEIAPETASLSNNNETSVAWVKKLAALKPDLVIGSQCD